MADTSRLPAGGSTVSPELLTLYELQRPFVEPLLQWCRLTNTAFDILFYDVGVLASALLAKGLIVDTTVPANASARHPLASLDLPLRPTRAAASLSWMPASRLLYASRFSK